MQGYFQDTPVSVHMTIITVPYFSGRYNSYDRHFLKKPINLMENIDERKTIEPERTEGARLQGR